MRPLTASEAADLARVCQHREIVSLHAPDAWAADSDWRIFVGHRARTLIRRRTLRACLRAAVRWMEENDAR